MEKDPNFDIYNLFILEDGIYKIGSAYIQRRNNNFLRSDYYHRKQERSICRNATPYEIEMANILLSLTPR